MNVAITKSGVKMTQEEFARMMTELNPEISEAIHALIDASMDVINSFKPPEHLHAAMQSWLIVRKKLNRNGFGALVDLSHPGQPIVKTFLLTGNERLDLGQGVDPLLDLQDDKGN